MSWILVISTDQSFVSVSGSVLSFDMLSMLVPVRLSIRQTFACAQVSYVKVAKAWANDEASSVFRTRAVPQWWTSL
jgi:hypothetical protein